MQMELAGDQVELFLRRLVQADPQKAVPALGGGVEGVADVAGDVFAAPAVVDGAVHNHDTTLWGIECGHVSEAAGPRCGPDRGARGCGTSEHATRDARAALRAKAERETR